jgi:hypothetical protein
VVDKWFPYPSALGVAWRNLLECWTEDCNQKGSRILGRRLVRSGLIVWWLIRILAKLLGSSLWLKPNQLTSFVDQNGIPLHWHLVERLYKEIERTYQPKPLDCRGIIISPEFFDRHGAVKAPDEFLGWKMRFKRGVRAFRASGDHFTMVREHSFALAQLIGHAAGMKWDEDRNSAE